MKGGNTRVQRAAMLLALLAPAAALAGCAEDGTAAPAATAGAANDTTTTDAPAPQATDAPGALDVATPAAPATLRTLYFDAGGKLVDALPAAGGETMAGGYASCFVTRPCSFLSYQSAPATTDLLVIPGEIVFDIWLEATAPVAPSTLFDTGVWFGTTKGTYVNTVDNGHDPILPGEPVHVQITLATSELAPIAVPMGEAIRALALSGRIHEEAGVLRILYGGDTPSAVTFTARELPAASLAKPAALNETRLSGTLEEPSFILGAVTGGGEGKTYSTHVVAIPADAQWVELELQATTSAIDKPDIDLDALVAGRVLGHAGTPADHESLLFAGPALDGIRGQDMTVVVKSFYAAKTTYDLAVRIG